MEYTGQTFFKKQIKSLGNETESVDVSPSLSLGIGAKRNWQAQVELSGNTTDGTLTISGKSPGASEFIDIETVDISAGDVIATFTGIFEELQVKAADLDASVVCDVFLCAV